MEKEPLENLQDQEDIEQGIEDPQEEVDESAEEKDLGDKYRVEESGEKSETHESWREVLPDLGKVKDALEQMRADKNQSWKIEAAIEKYKQFDEEEALIPREYKKESRLKKFMRTATAALMLGGIGKTAYDLKEAKNDIREQEIAQVEQAEEFDQKKAELIEQRVGFDLHEKAAEANFDAKMEIGNESGEYVVVVRQTHHTSDMLARITGQDEILESQKNIYIFLNSIISSSEDAEITLYDEGTYAESMETYEFLEKTVKRINNLPPTIETVEALIRLQWAISDYGEGIRINLHGIVNKKMADTLEYIQNDPDALEQAQAVYTKEFENKKSAYTLTDDLDSFDDSSDVIEAYKNKIENVFVDDFYLDYSKFSKEERALAHGATEKLFFEGKLNIRPAESKWLNNDGFGVIHRLDDLIDQLREADSEDAKKFIREQISQTKGVYDEHIYDRREDFAIRQITSQMDQDGTRLNFLVYGADHEFKDNVEKWNEENPDKKIGLITLSPKKKKLAETTK